MRTFFNFAVPRAGAEIAGYSTPVEYTVDGLQGLVLFGLNTLAGVARDTGELLWEIPWPAKYDENIADPIIQGDQMLVSSFLGDRCSLFDLGRNALVEQWQHKELLNWLASSVYWKGFVYGIDGNGKALKCMDFKTGAIRWAYEGLGKASLMMANEKLIILSDKGKLVVAPASPEAFKPVAEAQILEGKCWTVPVLANGRIYCRNADGDLVCVDVRK